MSEQSGSSCSYGSGTGNLHPAPPTRRRRRRRLVAIIAALIALLLITVILLFFFPRPAATVTLTPKIKTPSGSITGSYAPRALVPSSQQVTKTGKTQSGSPAYGMLTFKNYTPFWVTIPKGTVVSNVTSQQVMTLETIQVPPDLIIPGVASVTAQAVKAGGSANIPAMSINKLYSSGVYVLNIADFKGGVDGQVVQQSDIDQIAKPLVDSLLKAALKDLLSQLKPGERFIKATPSCPAPTITSNPGVGTSTPVFTVSASVKCMDLAYNPQSVPFQTEEMLKQQAVQFLSPGSDFVRVGDINIKIDQETPDANGEIGVQATASGTWKYQFTPAQKSNMAKNIARATIGDAKAWLLQQPGVAGASISVTGPIINLNRDTLPDDLRAITING